MKTTSRMTVQISLMLCVLLLAVFFCHAQTGVRTPINIPAIPGFEVLACDFHMHTVFSDGNVWPTVRVEEAWQEGLHGLAISDHIEYLPHKKDVLPDHNKPFTLAKGRAASLNMLLVKASEITRGIPPGHFNTLFMKDCKALDTPEFMDAINAAKAQGAFIFWNHPPFQQEGNKAIWHDIHTELCEKGLIHGIEIVNGKNYYPTVHQWCLDRKLTMIGNSDTHQPIAMDYDFAKGAHRPMTFVLARQKTKAAIKEALFARRTLVWWKTLLIGEAQYLSPVFEGAVKIQPPEPRLSAKGTAYLQVHNGSSFVFELRRQGKPKEISAPEQLTLHPGKTTLVRIKRLASTKPGKKTIAIPYRVDNLLVAPERGLDIQLKAAVNFLK